LHKHRWHRSHYNPWYIGGKYGLFKIIFLIMNFFKLWQTNLSKDREWQSFYRGFFSILGYGSKHSKPILGKYTLGNRRKWFWQKDGKLSFYLISLQTRFCLQFWGEHLLGIMANCFFDFRYSKIAKEGWIPFTKEFFLSFYAFDCTSSIIRSGPLETGGWANEDRFSFRI
jgi:hypothetical protein